MVRRVIAAGRARNADRRAVSLDDPAVVREEYATEAGLVARRAIYERLDGPDAREVAFAAIEECRPRRVLEVGPGPGELAARIAAETGAKVVALDVSPRMVELSRGRGVDARVGSAEELPWPDAWFDCAVAAWMLYHVADLDRALAELARVLIPGGRLVAVTNSERHLEEARSLVRIDMSGKVKFSRENGAAHLERHFASVERRDVDGWVTFPDADAVRSYVRSMVTERAAAERLPELPGPVRATSRTSVFVAQTDG
jgi:SAM-dependent methyltransferase